MLLYAWETSECCKKGECIRFGNKAAGMKRMQVLLPTRVYRRFSLNRVHGDLTTLCSSITSVKGTLSLLSRDRKAPVGQIGLTNGFFLDANTHQQGRTTVQIPFEPAAPSCV